MNAIEQELNKERCWKIIHAVGQAARQAWQDASLNYGYGAQEAAECAREAAAAMELAHEGHADRAEHHAKVATAWRLATAAAVEARLAQELAEQSHKTASEKDADYILAVESARAAAAL